MPQKRFRIAFSFPGEKRDFVSRVADILSQTFGKEAILYDHYHKSEFARVNLGLYLPELYHDHSDLVVVVLCPDYEKKEWCGLEWTAIHGLIKKRQENAIMLTRFGLVEGGGLFGLAGYVDLDKETPENAAVLILDRLAHNESKPKGTYSSNVLQTLPKSYDNISEAQMDELEPTTASNLLKNTSDVLQKYESFFSYCSRTPLLPFTFDNILIQSERNPLSLHSLHVSALTGYPGTGKSTFLTCAFFKQWQKCRQGQSIYHPLLLNLNRHHSNYIQSTNAADLLRKTYQTLLQEISVLKSNHIMLMVDGCDEYFRHSNQAITDRELRSIVRELVLHYQVVAIVCLGQNETTFPFDQHQDRLSWVDQRSEIVQLVRVSSDASEYNQLLQTYAHISTFTEIDFEETLRQLIKDYKITELDLFILSLLDMAKRRNWHDPHSGIGALYYSYCKDQIDRIHNNELTKDLLHEKIKQLAQEAYELYVLRSNSSGDSVSALDTAPNANIALSSKIAYAHGSVKEFLIAEHVVDMLLSTNSDNAQRERFIYPYGVNRFVKGLINRANTVQEYVYNAITKVYPKALPREQIHLAYMLGRLEDKRLQEKARTLLRSYLDRLVSSDAQIRTLKNVITIKDRQVLLLQRTIYISLGYLGDDFAATDYLKTILDEPAHDDLNRGFHLEYYEDAPRPAALDEMIASDNLEIEPVKTINVLLSKLSRDLLLNKARPMTCIELHTLCSLCLNRHIAGRLSEASRSALESLLKRIKINRFTAFPAEQNGYLEMAEKILSHSSYSAGEVYLELNSLKTEKRNGWNAERPHGGSKYIRRVANSESVSDHILGCMRIAEMCLPELDDDPAHTVPYDKSTILLMLHIHDLSEAYTGDIPSFKKNKLDQAKEEQVMKYILSLSGLAPFAGIAKWKNAWQEYRYNKSSINAKIATEIDLIENYMQLRKYLDTQDCVIEDAEIWANEIDEGVQTKIGRSILNAFRHKGAGLLEWHRGAEIEPQ